MEADANADLVNRLQEILRKPKFSTAAAETVKKQLEKDFGVDLSDQKAFLNSQIDIYRQGKGKESENVEPIADLEEDVTAAIEDIAEGIESPVNEEDKKVNRRSDIHKPYRLSPELVKFVGAPALPRFKVLSKLLEYIKQNELQPPKDRSKIICDESLPAIFGVKTMNNNQMNKMLAEHWQPSSSETGIICFFLS